MALAPDPKWLELLKASGWQTTAISCACFAILFLTKAGFLPAVGPTFTVTLALGGVVCGFLAIASILSATFRALPLRRWIAQIGHKRRVKRGVESYIPFMSPEERKIVGYLLYNNRKSFTCSVDGGLASTLISRGIIASALRPGQTFHSSDMPMTVPDDVWEVLCSHKATFPPPLPGEPHPWRVHWMAR